MVNIANLGLLDSVDLGKLRKIFFAGEVFPTKHLNIWRRRLPDAQFVNLYGPIEITVDCTYFVVDRELRDDEPLPIGFPCRNTSILILDDRNQLAKANEPGELCVRGSSLALGYWNDPEKTAKAFVQNPLNTHLPRADLHAATGDLVSRQNDRGEILFLGRKDFQIKHMGYRIELGEIEHLVASIGLVDNACVLYHRERKEITLFFEAKQPVPASAIRCGARARGHPPEVHAAHRLPSDGGVAAKPERQDRSPGTIDAAGEARVKSLLPTVAAVYAQVELAKRAGSLVTNFYPAHDKLQRAIDRRELYSTTVGDVLFVLRRDRDFIHLSFVASAASDLGAAVRALAASVPEALTVDVLGPRDRVEPLAELFVQAGFRAHRTLGRMTRLGDVRPSETDPEVVLATGDDGPALARMLEIALDRYAEQIPDTDEMTTAAAGRKVLIIRSGTAIAGLLFFEATGQSSLLRHWLVDPAHREQRIGARLMRRYFAECNDVRRFLLWVISDNDNAIDRYRHYGYKHDGLIDQVLIRQAS